MFGYFSIFYSFIYITTHKIHTCPQVLHSMVLRKNKDPLTHWPLPIMFVCLSQYLHRLIGDTAYFYAKIGHFHHLLSQPPEF